MDMDGFVINKKFYGKELGLLKVGDVAARSHFFDIGFEWSELSGKDRRTWDYVMRFIHKLPFGVPWGVGAYELSVLEEIVATFYYRAKRNERSIIAYTGGHFERDLLAKLDIPAYRMIWCLLIHNPHSRSRRETNLFYKKFIEITQNL